MKADRFEPAALSLPPSVSGRLMKESGDFTQAIDHINRPDIK